MIDVLITPKVNGGDKLFLRVPVKTIGITRNGKWLGGNLNKPHVFTKGNQLLVLGKVQFCPYLFKTFFDTT